MQVQAIMIGKGPMKSMKLKRKMTYADSPSYNPRVFTWSEV